MSSGPLVLLPLTVPGLLGFPVDYAAGRAVGLLLSWGVVVFAYLSLRHVHGDRLARQLNLPLACFMVLLSFWDFTAYVSEWLPLFLCAAATWLCLTAFQLDGAVRSRWRLAGAGVVLGILPFSKFQALPLGAAIGLVAVLLALFQPRLVRHHLGRDLLALLGSAAAGFLVFACWVWSSGNAGQFYQSYVQYNLFYAQSRDVPWSASINEMGYLAGFSWGFSSFAGGLVLLLVPGLFALRGLPRGAWRQLILGGSLLAAAAYAVTAPGRAYPHYLLFLTLPLALSVGLLFGHLLAPDRVRRPLHLGLCFLFILAGAGGQIAERFFANQSLTRLMPDAGTRAGMVALIDRLKQPGDALAVWGWRPELYVESQLAQAVREAHTERQMMKSPLQAYFRTRFLADVEATQPAFFVDAVGSKGFLYQDRAVNGLETFAGLNDYIGRHYQLVGEADSFRLYVRRAWLQPMVH
jgi:hypothetical protein